MSKIELLYQRHLDYLRALSSEKNISFSDALMSMFSPLAKNELLAVMLWGLDAYFEMPCAPISMSRDHPF